MQDVYDLLRRRFRIPPKRPKRITAVLRCAPPFGRCLGLGPSLAQSRRLLRKVATAAPSRVCPCAQPAPRSRRLLAQPPRPRCRFVNPQDVICNCSFGRRRFRAPPDNHIDKPNSYEYILAGQFIVENSHSGGPIYCRE